MIRLVGKYRRDLLRDTHLHLAQQLQHEGNLKQSEHHYVESGAWHGAVDMQRSHTLWDEALRVVKSHGTSKEVSEVAKKWASSLGHEKGSRLLQKLGLIEAAIDFEADQSE